MLISTELTSRNWTSSFKTSTILKATLCWGLRTKLMKAVTWQISQLTTSPCKILSWLRPIPRMSRGQIQVWTTRALLQTLSIWDQHSEAIKNKLEMESLEIKLYLPLRSRSMTFITTIIRTLSKTSTSRRGWWLRTISCNRRNLTLIRIS